MKSPEKANEAARNGDLLHDSSDTDNHEKHEHGPHDFQSVPAEPVHNSNVFDQGSKSYRTMKRWATIFMLFTNQIGLGILSLPTVLKTLGIVPGLIAIIGIGVISWYTAYELLQFYNIHSHVVNVVEMTRVVGGRYLEMIAGTMMMVQVIFVAASAVVTLSIALNTISDHAICTVVFIFTSCFVCYLFNIPRTMKFVSHSGIPNAVSVLTAAMVVMISLGVAGPMGAPKGWEKEIVIVGNPSFRDGVNACLKVVYAYASNIAFVGYMAEMVDPAKDFGFCLAFLEVGSMVLYVIIAIVVYCLAGQYSVSPALGSAPTIPAKIAYGVVLPAVFATGIAYGHVGGKYVYVIAMRKMGAAQEITANTKKAWTTWLTCVTGFWIVVFTISNVIPIFDSILSITSATTISWFTYGFSAVFWFHANWDDVFRGWKQITLTVINSLLIIMSLFMNGAGLWSSLTELLDLFNADDSSIRGVFSCGSNAQF
ncbi:hypothetical protein AK830_g7039 [Neonectria ditissima]|uniref:Amino acid transporter transmembrane domain-containing protein n=1 Tax=Neonectria ditissima TaxID=78410 RepID=A0A0P7BG44_9HYPO|nr:hypothetical protein AK830_g7039 [Neonectria ditissima]